MTKHFNSLKIYCDGGSRGNPGPAAAGAVFCDSDGQVVGEFHQYLGVATNNVAEYTAVLLAINELKNYSVTGPINFYLDSELVVRQLSGNYKVKNETLKPLHAQIQAWVTNPDRKVTFTHVLRANNTLADAQVNICLDEIADQ